MNRCPVEIMDVIMELACADGGSTGRALSLVSKLVSEVSRPYILNSIALYGINQVERFSTFISTPDKTRTSRVRHLFISRIRPHKEPRKRIPGQRYPSGFSLTITDQSNYRRQWMNIFHAVSPTLISLVVIDEDIPNMQILGHDWPVLEDLSLSVDSPINWVQSREFPVQLPALKRLTLIAHIADPFPSFFHHACLTFPNLTHLRLSGFEDILCFAEDLSVALGQREYDPQSITRWPNSKPSLPQNIQCVSIHVGKQAYFRPRIAGWRSRAEVVADLRELAYGGIITLTEGEREGRGEFFVFMMRKHWLECVNGLEGPWNFGGRHMTAIDPLPEAVVVEDNVASAST
ncbi:hypothetical protein BD410DRAFT_793892 [Rickenella mellea]|uniref:F-box domain-containing protein n=1 Tax=Rickenella mellea TaxID=50990 RepID=A0A4Y7PRY7_9AGAM|nr:hypothetical protein BD410DRAFT_793892 [Rickenella mellea]